MKIKELELIANQIRKDVIYLVGKIEPGHVGGSLSICDIMTALYFEIMNVSPENIDDDRRDRFVLSKGHCNEVYMATLANRGFIDKESLETYCNYLSKYCAHPSKNIKGVEVSTGSLGHGLSIACGMALNSKKSNLNYDVYVVLGDGELAEGSNYEALMFANKYQLDNLYVIVDRNGLQISGTTEEIMPLNPLKEKMETFGFYTEEIDGNNMDVVVKTFNKLKEIKNKPKMMIAKTVKGKGVSFMENELKWHEGGLNIEEYKIAMQDLEKIDKQLKEDIYG